MSELDEGRFEMLADRTLNAMVDALDDLEDDNLDAQLESGVLTVRFADGSQFVVNSHRAARQIWMSADSQAWHFDWRDDRWISTRSDDELWSTLNARASAKLGRPLQLAGPS